MVEVGDVVELGELSAVVGRRVGLGLFQGLTPEVAAVDEEENASRAEVAEETIERSVAVNVSAAPVAICTSARGRPSRKLTSRFSIARTCAGHVPVASSGGASGCGASARAARPFSFPADRVPHLTGRRGTPAAGTRTSPAPRGSDRARS